MPQVTWFVISLNEIEQLLSPTRAISYSRERKGYRDRRKDRGSKKLRATFRDWLRSCTTSLLIHRSPGHL